MKKNKPNNIKLPASAKRMLHPELGFRVWLIDGQWYRSRADWWETQQPKKVIPIPPAEVEVTELNPVSFDIEITP